MSTVNLPSASSAAGKPVGQPGKLKAVDLNFFYGAFQALHGISLDVPGNKITALIGPSGCGKSTFLRTLNRISETIRNTRVEGQVLLDDEDVLKVDVTALRRRVGMVFQKSNPFPKSIFDNVAYGLKVNGFQGSLSRCGGEQPEARGAVGRSEGQACTNRPMRFRAGSSSGLCIARALAVDPEVLLLDEPCSALDPIATAKIEDLLFTLKDQCTHRDRDAQHAAGGARGRPYRLFSAGKADRVQYD